MENPIQSGSIVKQVFDAFPQTIPVFMELKTLCVGCPLKRFCTLEDVARAHHIPQDVLLQKLCSSMENQWRRNA
jgi:hybrid cluster-associated redox disulfide protein